jgi:hypothetical protein
MLNTNRYSNFPYGFKNGVLLQGLPFNPTTPSSVYWVGNNPILEYNEKLASDVNAGSYYQPKATIAGALSACLAGNANTIIVREGYTQTITSAGGLTIGGIDAKGNTLSNITIIGLGNGSSRPTLTFSTATTASCLINVANVTLSNFIGVAGIASLTQPFNVTASNCSLDVEWQDASSAVTAVRAVLTSAISNFNLNLVYKGFVGNAISVNAVRLVGVTGGNINVSSYGTNSTAVVEFSTTASTNIVVTTPANSMIYNSSSTTATKDVVDTITGSTWFALVNDGSAGAVYQGGSATSGTLTKQ